MRTSDLTGGLPYGTGWVQCDFSFPLNLIQVGSPFFLVDHSCPDVAIYFRVSVEKCFFFHLQDFFFFCHQKNTYELCVVVPPPPRPRPPDCDLTSVDS